VNIHVFHIDGSGERFQRVIVKSVQRSHELQVLGHALRDGLRQCMVLDSQRNVRAQHLKRIEFAIFIQ
jgi:hypothetical protein